MYDANDAYSYGYPSTTERATESDIESRQLTNPGSSSPPTVTRFFGG